MGKYIGGNREYEEEQVGVGRWPGMVATWRRQEQEVRKELP